MADPTPMKSKSTAKAKSAPAPAPEPPAKAEPKNVRIRMTQGAAGALPQAWLVSPGMFGLSGGGEYRVGPDEAGTLVPYALALALTDKKHAERCRGRCFEIL